VKSVIPVVVSDKSAKISDNQGHLTKMLVNSSFVAFDNHESDPSSSLIRKLPKGSSKLESIVQS
jgi:hypothetical protein